MVTLLKIQKALWGTVLMLGPWGIFLAGLVDGAGVPLLGGVDALMIAFVFKTPSRAWLFVLLAIFGSLLGCLVLYLIGFLGGEMVLERRMSPEKFHKISRDFDNNAFLTLAVPALLPPPFPFKAFVLAAGAFEIKWTHFLSAIFVGRLIRYGALAVLTLTLGPGAVAWFAGLIRRHPLESVIVLAAVVVIAVLVHRSRQKASPVQSSPRVTMESAQEGRAD
jgi:membrane protein YqaA with SNARE-associated domain